MLHSFEVTLLFGLYAAYQFIFRVVSPAVCQRFIFGYQRFTEPQRIKFHSGNTSLCSTVLVLVLGTLILSGNSNGSIWNGVELVNIFMCNSVAYFISDLRIMSTHKETKTLPSVMIHHFISLIATAIILKHPVFSYYHVFRSLSEIVQPLFHLRFYIRCLNLGDTKIDHVTGALLTITFFLSRVIVIPLFWIQFVSDEEMTITFRNNKVETGFLISTCLALDILNLYWFSVMLKVWKNFIATSKLMSHNSEILSDTKSY